MTVTISAHSLFRWLLVSLCLCSVGRSSSYAFASTPPETDLIPPMNQPGGALPEAPAPQIAVTEKGLPLAILKDQLAVWTSPARIRAHDLIWLLPLGAATGLTLATDTNAMRELSHNPSFNKDSVNASNTLLGSQIAIPVALYGAGLIKGDA